jgi:hypothetical protein
MTPSPPPALQIEEIADAVYFNGETSSGTQRKEESNGFALAEFLSGFRGLTSHGEL